MSFRARACLSLILAFSFTFATAGCKAKRRVRVETVEEEAGPLVSFVKMSEPKTAVQLVRGFYSLEAGAWRWTKGQFSLTLRTPAGAAQNGARLELKGVLPDAVISRVHETTLECVINGQAIEPLKLTKEGEFLLTRDVPASALSADSVTLDFRLDKFLAAGQVEERELGIIVLSVGLFKK